MSRIINQSKFRLLKHNNNFNSEFKNEIDGEYVKNIQSLRNKLSIYNMTLSDYYINFLYTKFDSLVCKCGNKTHFINFNYGFTETCESQTCNFYREYVINVANINNLNYFVDVRNDNIYITVRSFLNKLRLENITSKEYYDAYLKKADEGICPCGNYTNFNSLTNGYNKYCKFKCDSINDRRVESIKNRFKGESGKIKLKNFTDSVHKIYKSRTVEDKARIFNKRMSTMEKTAKSKNMSIDEYKSEISKNSYKKFVDRLGDNLDSFYDNVMRKKHSVDGNPKSGYRDYNLYGDIIKIQGYEDIVLNTLQKNPLVNNITTGGKTVNSIIYYNNGKRHRYYPDIIINDNIYIEVKSTYTATLHKDVLINKLKYTSINSLIILIILSNLEARNGILDGYNKKLIDWAISSQASKHNGIIMYDEGSTTILYGVVPSGTKCKCSSDIEECDIVWSALKDVAV